MSAPHTAPVPAPHATPNANSPRGEVVLVTGMSGGGKSIAMHALEDAGFYCVDNLPPELLPQFLELERQRGDARRRDGATVAPPASVGTRTSGPNAGPTPEARLPIEERNLLRAMLEGGSSVVARVASEFRPEELSHPAARALGSVLLEKNTWSC